MSLYSQYQSVSKTARILLAMAITLYGLLLIETRSTIFQEAENSIRTRIGLGSLDPDAWPESVPLKGCRADWIKKEDLPRGLIEKDGVVPFGARIVPSHPFDDTAAFVCTVEGETKTPIWQGYNAERQPSGIYR